MLILKDPQRSKDQVVLPFLHFGSLFGVRVLKSDVGSRWAGGYRLSFGSLGISTSELSTFPSPSTLRSCILSLSHPFPVTSLPPLFRLLWSSASRRHRGSFWRHKRAVLVERPQLEKRGLRSRAVVKQQDPHLSVHGLSWSKVVMNSVPPKTLGSITHMRAAVYTVRLN